MVKTNTKPAPAPAAAAAAEEKPEQVKSEPDTTTPTNAPAAAEATTTEPQERSVYFQPVRVTDWNDPSPQRHSVLHVPEEWKSAEMDYRLIRTKETDGRDADGNIMTHRHNGWELITRIARRCDEPIPDNAFNLDGIIIFGSHMALVHRTLAQSEAYGRYCRQQSAAEVATRLAESNEYQDRALRGHAPSAAQEERLMAEGAME